ncbi:MAG TPA: hypothetical protein VGJ04_00930, partial [Pirellulales bacterium]
LGRGISAFGEGWDRSLLAPASCICIVCDLNSGRAATPLLDGQSAQPKNVFGWTSFAAATCDLGEVEVMSWG